MEATNCEQTISGLTIPEWCEKNQFSPHAYYYWRKIIRTQKDEHSDLPIAAFAEIRQTEKAPVLSSGVLLTWKENFWMG
ncbi:IS66 family insertion sequence element accessory protein TnpA [Lachnospiraceae bacterium LCP25S3_G4]